MLHLKIITGPGGDAQGWGDLSVTKALCSALEAAGLSVEQHYVETLSDFRMVLQTGTFDLVWSSLYYFSRRSDYIALSDQVVWVADILDELALPYIGPDAISMKNLIHKYRTHQLLRAAGVPVPEHSLVSLAEAAPKRQFPVFVKPEGESRSIGINDNSVVYDYEQMERQVKFIHQELQQAALIETYLPGEEYTTLVLGNGARQEILPGIVQVDPKYYGRHRILRSDLRGVGLTKIFKPNNPQQHEEAVKLSCQAALALNCHDHVRIDIRADAQQQLRIIEINGIPGLKPGKSWSPQIYSLYHPNPADPQQEYQALLLKIVSSACQRYNLSI